MLTVARVLPSGTAARIGIEAGDRILTINGEAVPDVIDYRFLVADERVVIEIEKRDRRIRRIRITKEPDDALGIEFQPYPVKRCRNKCIFCFVDQMPPGCRPSLSVKDDDYRASFQYGNYITLGNLTERDWERIFRYRLSPLYISVHATEPGLRSMLLGNERAPDIMAGLRRLADGGIRMHTQVVTCPGVNDGPHLQKTVQDLAGLHPSVLSVAVVPVGLTAWRRGLYPLRPFTKAQARGVVTSVEDLGKAYRKTIGTRFAFCSDEFYLKAGMPIPPAAFYEDFPQLENGVGMAADFFREVARTRLPSRVDPCRVTVVTGMSFGGLLKDTARRFDLVSGAKVRVIPVANRFFGPSVTVSGLLAGADIIAGLQGKRLGDLVVVPANALKDDSMLFLDDMTVGEVERALGKPVRAVWGFREMARLLREGGSKI